MRKEDNMDKKAIGRRLRELRGSRTQNEVADAIGISVTAVGMYERGERIPRDEIKVKLAVFYGKTVEEIFFDKNDTPTVSKE